MNSLTPPCCHLPADCLFVGAGGGERMPETGAVSRQDGAGRGSDGEGLAAAPDEEPESQHQLDPAVFSSRHHSSVSPLLACIHRGRRSRLGRVTEGKTEI